MAQTEEFILISDLDDTLLGDEDGLHDFVAFRESIQDRVRLQLIYASGRFYETIREDIEKTILPEPIAVIGGVGSEIRRFPEGTFVEEWKEQMSADWSASRIRNILSEDPGLEPQPEENQSDFKVSYHAHDASEEQLSRWEDRLRSEGLRFQIVYSSNRDLDFLPEGVDKGSAAKFMADLFGYPAERVLVAGNSANDSALFEHRFRGIVVGNAHGELKSLTGPENVYLSPHSIAAGVRDGVEHWLRQDTLL